METVALLYEDYQKELAEDFKNTFLKRASDTDSSRSNDTVIDEVTDMLSTNIAVYTEKLLQRWGFSSGGEGGGGGDVTVTLDDLLKKYLSDNYVTIKGDQEVFGEKDFRKGIRIAGRRLYWDEGNDALVIEGAAYTTRWLSAKGVSPGGGGGGLINLVYGFESLGGTFDNNDNSATFNAFTINEIWKLASSGLTNVTVTGSGNAVTDVIKGSDGRSLTFTKGSTFATKSEFDALNTKFNDFLTGSDADDIINKWSELEVFLQGMKESDNLAVILQSKMDKTAFSKLFTALDASGNEVDPSDDTKTIASIRANFGFWGVDYISAKGVSKGSGGTGGASTLYQLVDVLANDTEDGVEGAAAGKALVFDGTHWRAGDAGLNESQLYSYLTANKYLTQSAADSRYVTSSRKVIAGTGLSGGGALTSDVTLSLGTSGVVAGTYTKVMVDAYGRVTSGTNLSATDIPNLDWSKITTGKPTTLAGYGITDAVTLTTAQTISGRKTFSQNIVFNNNGGITYTDSNVVLRNSDGHTILASFGNGEINLRPNGHNNTEGAVWINKKGNVQAPSVSTNTITIGDAQLVYDSVNKALRVKHRADGNTVGLYSDGWVSALGVKTGGSGVVNTVYSFANLTDGTTFSDSDLDNTFNAYTIKKLYDMAGQGGLDADAMWAELKKADSSKIIDASHIPTSVLDGRWVTISTNQNITGQKTFTQQLKSTVATGLSPLIVSSNTTVDNLSADLLDGYHAFGTSNALIKYGYTVSGTEPAWCRIATYSIRDTETMTDVCFVLHSSFSDLFGLLVVKTRGGAYVKGLLIASYNINTSNIRIYHDAEKRNIELYCHGGNNYSVIQANLLYSHDRYGEANTNITLYRGDTKAPSWSTYVNPVFAPLQNSSEVAKKLQTPRTLWGQSFDGTANVSGNMTGVGSITMSGDLKIGNATSPNTIYFYGTTGDGPGGYNHTFIAERIWGGTECSELVLFKGNDLSTNNTDATTIGGPGPDRIRHIAAAHLFQTYTTALAGSVESVCTSSVLSNLFSIAPNRVISYVPLQSTVASGTAPFIVASNTVVSNLNADLLDGVHLAGFGGREGVMRSWLRGIYTTVNQYFGNGNVVTIDPKPTDDATLSANTTVLSLGDVPTRNTQLAFHYDSNTIKYRRHDDSKWNDWVVLIHSGNYASYSDGRYVKKAGDTMTGDLAMDTNKGFYIPNGTRVVKSSGNWIHGGGDTASSTDANLRFGSWYGIGWYPTVSGGSVAQGNNAMWLNVRNGNLDTHGAITAHTNYLAANWNSARRLVLGGGSSYAWIDSRNSSNNVLCSIVLEDNKVFIGNYAESSRFVSTVGTGTAPYQCSSTTLNTNLNADLLDNWHIMDIPRNYNSTATYSLQFALGGTDNNWKKIFACSESGAGPYRSVTVWGRIWYAYGNHAQGEVISYHFCAIFQMRSGPSASDSNVGDISNSARLYLPTFAKGMDNIRLVRVGTNNFELQVRQIGSYNNGYIQYQYWANGANVSAWRGLQSTSNTSVAVSAGGASTLADSRASSADVWTTARTFYIQDYHSANTGAGVSVNGGSNCYLKLPSTTRFSRIDFSTPNANIRHSGNDNGNEVGSSTLSNLVIDSWYGVSFTTTCSSTYQNKIAMSVNCRTGRVTANNFHAATNITANGAITAKASSSDIRLKTDIQGYDAMGIIRKFRSVKYHWNAIAKENSEVFNHDNWNYGLIAQDLLSGGYSQWVKDAFNDYYTIDYERLIPVVWKGLQEVDDEVTKLKREVARLNKRVKELEKSLCA
nr:MAG: chaperone of endosialidase [Bacteriophage sp.]